MFQLCNQASTLACEMSEGAEMAIWPVVGLGMLASRTNETTEITWFNPPVFYMRKLNSEE